MDRALRYSQGRMAFRGLLIFMAISLGVMFFVRVKLMTHYTLDMGGADQNVVQGTLRVMLGEPLYGDPEEPPFPAIQYSPAFFYVHAMACEVSGVNAADVQGVYVVGRAISLIFNLITAWLVMLVCHRLGSGPILAFAAGAFFFTSLTDMYFLRPDSLYAMFFWCHVFLVVRAAMDGHLVWNNKVLILGSLFAVLAIFSKQTGSIVPVMTGAVLLFHQQWRTFFKFSVACAAWAIIFLAILFLGNEPWAIYQNVVLGNVNGTALAPMLVHLTNRYGLPITIWMSIGVLMSIHVIRARRPQVQIYVACTLLITLGWALITALKRGSNTNYYTESQMLSVVLCTALLADVQWQRWRSAIYGAVLIFMPFTALLRSAMFFNATMITKFRANEPAVYFSEMELSRKVIAHGLASDEYVFALRRGFSELFLMPHSLLVAKSIVSVSDEYLAFDLDEFDRMAEDGRLKYVIAPSDRTDLEFHGTEFKGFVPLFELDGRTVHIHQKATTY